MRGPQRDAVPTLDGTRTATARYALVCLLAYSGDWIGPRGGGRDRDEIVRHTRAAELDWATKLGVLTPLDAMLTDKGLNAHRDA